MPVLGKEGKNGDGQTELVDQRSISPENISLLDLIVVLCLSAFIVIFVFAISASELGNYQFRLPSFLTNSIETIWSLAAAGGLAVTGSVLNAALTRRPKRVNYVKYVLGVTAALFVPIVGLLWFGEANRYASWQAPFTANVRLDLSRGAIKNREFSLSPLPLPNGLLPPVLLYLSGDVSLESGNLNGVASGRVVLAGPLPDREFLPLHIGIYLCYYKSVPGSPFPMYATAPASINSANMSTIRTLPPRSRVINVPRFQFSIEVPRVEDPQATWLCAKLGDQVYRLISFSN